MKSKLHVAMQVSWLPQVRAVQADRQSLNNQLGAVLRLIACQCNYD
jgi:hypothetical protein